MDSIESLIYFVEEWADDRNLIEGATPHAQFHKLIQECAELSDNMCKGKDCTDDIGDILIVLIIIARQLDLDIFECLTTAYNDIKDRKGTMINGVFVKDESTN
jgi:NTP pyrophosphatase (non-canonical NTP hydrolase)